MLSSLQTVDEMHMATPSPVTTVLIFPEKYKKKKTNKKQTTQTVTKLDLDLN